MNITETLSLIDRNGKDLLWLFKQVNYANYDVFSVTILEDIAFNLNPTTAIVIHDSEKYLPSIELMKTMFNKDGLYVFSWGDDIYNAGVYVLIFTIDDTIKYYMIVAVDDPEPDIIVHEYISLEEMHRVMEQAIEANNIFDYTNLFTRGLTSEHGQYYMEKARHEHLSEVKRNAYDILYWSVPQTLEMGMFKENIRTHIRKLPASKTPETDKFQWCN